jgi:hypothetical protein
LVLQERFIPTADRIGERPGRNHVARELTGHRVTAEEPVRGICEGFAGPVEARRVRRHEPEAAPQRGGRGDDGAAGGRDTCGEQRAA